MKTIASLIVAFLAFGLVSNASAAGKLHHVVCFKFKSSASKDDIKKVEDAFLALKDKVPGIEAFKWGTNVSKEQKNKGFTHCYLITFKSEKDRDAYLENPEHKAFASLVGPVVDDVFVIDFVTAKK